MPVSPVPDIKLALALHQKQDLPKAERAYRQILQAQPRHSDALNLLGVLLQQTGRLDEALLLIQSAIAVRADVASYHGNLGALLSKCGKPEQAVKALQVALRLAPDDADTHFNLGVAANKAGDAALAHTALLRASVLRPGHAATWVSLGHTLREQGAVAEAQSAYQRALGLDPKQSRAWFGMALCAEARNETDAAAEAYGKAITIDPTFEKPLHNLGNHYLRLREIPRAIALYNAAITHRPDYAEAHYHLAHALFMQGDVAGAWDEYAWRLAMPRFAESGGIRAYQKPLWNGEPLQGKRLHIYREQGIGDEIMFAQCLADLQAAGVKATVECEARLKPLFARAFEGLQIMGSHETRAHDESGFDVQCPMGSLPRIYRKSVESLQQRKAYLKADASAKLLWQKKFDALPHALTVGISWRGGGDGVQQQLRSIPLDSWMTLLARPVNFVSLQYGDHQAEIDAVNRKAGRVVLHQFPEVNPLHDMDAQAAQIAALDWVISIDNATVHLAGALGTPTWILMPFASEWRWALANEDLWYASAKFFRQPQANDWTHPMAAVDSALNHRIADTRGPSLEATDCRTS